MKTTNILILIGIVVSLSSVNAQNINIPDSDFTNSSATISAPLIGLAGISSGTLGPWKAQIAYTLTVGGKIESGTASSLGAPTPPVGTDVLEVQMPVSASTAFTVSQLLTNTFQPNTTYNLTVDIDPGTVANLLSGSALSLTSGTNVIGSLSGSQLLNLLQISD